MQKGVIRSERPARGRLSRIAKNKKTIATGRDSVEPRPPGKLEKDYAPGAASAGGGGVWPGGGATMSGTGYRNFITSSTSTSTK